MNLLDYMAPSYPHVGGYKRTDTSREAANSIDASGIRAKVLQAIREMGPATADETAAFLGLSILTVRPRCTELRALGKLVDTGFRRPNSSGRSAICWKAP